MNKKEIGNKIKESGLKVTPQRIAVLDAIYELKNHPTADNLIEFVRNNNPGIASGTVYKVVETLVENKLVQKVKTESGVMRYDGMMDSHHHMYCSSCDMIEDYRDDDLDKILQEYFKDKNLPGFTINDIRVEIKGKFDKC